MISITLIQSKCQFASLFSFFSFLFVPRRCVFSFLSLPRFCLFFLVYAPNHNKIFTLSHIVNLIEKGWQSLVEYRLFHLQHFRDRLF